VWSSRRVALAVAVLSGCALSGSQWEVKDRPLTCEEANRITYRTIEAMRFRVSAVEPAAPGQRGTIAASRPVRGAPGQTQAMTATIDCAPSGVSVEVRADGVLAPQLELQRGFYQTFANVQAMRIAEAELAAQVRAGTAPAAQQRRDLKVVLQPRPGAAAKLEFPFDFAAAGVLPVRIDVTNLSERTYTLDVAQVRLARADRTRVPPLPPREAATRLAARLGVDAAAIAEALAARELQSSELPPGAQRVGYLFFPLDDYTGGRLVLTDRESGEDEGVRVQF